MWIHLDCVLHAQFVKLRYSGRAPWACRRSQEAVWFILLPHWGFLRSALQTSIHWIHFFFARPDEIILPFYLLGIRMPQKIYSNKGEPPLATATYFWLLLILAFLARIFDLTEGSLEVKLPTIWTDGKAEVGRVREEKSRSEKRKRKRKEDAGARKGSKVAKHCVFPMICGSGGSKSRLAKAAGAEPCGQMRDEKLHAVVARSTIASEKAKNTSRSDHFWKLRLRKSARRCGAKHISKSKCTKYTTFRPLLEVEMSIKNACRCGTKHISKSKVYKTDGFGALLDVRCRFAWLVKSEQNVRVVWHFQLQPLHYTTFHSTTTTTTTTLQTTLHYTTDYITLHYTTFHYNTLLTLLTLHSTSLQLQLIATTLYYTTIHFLHYNTLITLHYATLHFTTLHYNQLHYTTTTTTATTTTTLR